MQHGAVLSTEAAQGIQRLVSAAVPNLDTANVVILDEHGKLVDGGAQVREENPSEPSAADEQKRAIEQYYESKIRLALEHAYPLSAFAVAVSAALPASAPNDATNPEWNPASRTFPLNVDIASPKPVDPSVQDAVRTAASAAIGLDPAKNDVVRFTVSAPVAVSPAPPMVQRHHPLMGPQLVLNDSEQPAATIAVFVLFVLVGVVILWLLLRPRRLTKTQAANMADRLRILLEQEEGSAAS
jgi:flagellar M-ring protein FliF